MSLYTKVCFVILGYFFSSIIVLNTCVCKKLDGYKFPVYLTEFCPRNESEWNKRSSALKCNETNGYMCLPNGKLTELLEFCFTKPFIWIEKGVCLSLEGKGEIFGSYSCSHFIGGCHNNSFQSSRIFDYPACITIGNGCFLANQSCKSFSNGTSGINKDDCVWVLIVMSIIVVVSFSSFMLYVYRKRKSSSCKRGNEIKNTSHESEELRILIEDTENVKKDISTEPYRCIDANSLDNIEEKVSFTANVGTDKKDFSYEVMLESSSCLRGNAIEGTLNETEERKSLMADTENVKSDFSKEPYKRGIGVKNQDDMKETESFTANIGTDKDSSYKGIQLRKRRDDEELHTETALELSPLIQTDKHDNAVLMEQVNEHGKKKQEALSVQESPLDRAILMQWQDDNRQFVSTRACKEVEKLIKSQNLVAVTGNSGSGKSAIIQHIALCYRDQGWTVKPVYKVKEITDTFQQVVELHSRIIFVYNDPIGKESFEEILYNAWKEHEERLKACLKNVKILLSCRKYILTDRRVKGILSDKSCIINLSNDNLKLNYDEKKKIVTIYSRNDNISIEEMNVITQTEEYFPLLCKLYLSENAEGKKKLRFFQEPIEEFKNEVKNFKSSSKEKYFTLALLVLFNGKLCVRDIEENEKSKTKIQLALDMSGLIKIAPHTIVDTLSTLEGFFIKKIGDTYHFHHDFVMEVTIYVIGTDNLLKIIENTDIGFLRRRVKLESCNDKNDKLFIHLTDTFIYDYAKRLFDEIFGDGLLDVVLNPCLRNEKVIKIFEEILNSHPEKQPLLCENVRLPTEEGERLQILKNSMISKLDLVYERNEISPLIALIICCHTELSLCCLKALQKIPTEFKDIHLFIAVCCNGSLDLYATFTEDEVKHLLSENWEDFHPVHIAAMFHNHEILCKLIQAGVDINLIMDEDTECTPLFLAIYNDEEEILETNKSISKKYMTIKFLMDNGAVMFFKEEIFSPFFVACCLGIENVVTMLLVNGEDINFCDKYGRSPVYIACENGHQSTVQLLLTNGANINLCTENGASPLLIACQNGDDSTVQLLLHNGADIESCDECGHSPLIMACENGYDTIVQHLLTNGADINLCDKYGHSPLYMACQNGHDTIVQLLLDNNADMYLCDENGRNPLYLACCLGNENILQLLLIKEADINIFEDDRLNPLYRAIQNGYDIIVDLLLNNGARVNECDKNGASPLYKACQNGHESSVQSLLSKGADVSLCDKNRVSPLFVACQNGYDVVVQLLLSVEADIDYCDKNGTSPLYIACENGHESTVQLLLSNGADVNLCNENGFSPLFLAFAYRYCTIVKMLLERKANTVISNGCGFKHGVLNCSDKNDKTMQYLLQTDNIFENMHDQDSYFSLFVFCRLEQMLRMSY